MAARTQTLMQPRRPNYRAFLAFLFGVVAAGVHPGRHRADAEDPGRRSARRGLGDSGRRRRGDRVAALRPRRARRDRADARARRRLGVDPARPHPRRGGHLRHALRLDRRRPVRAPLAPRALDRKTPGVFEIGNSLREARERQGLGYPGDRARDEDPREVHPRARGGGLHGDPGRRVHPRLPAHVRRLPRARR